MAEYPCCQDYPHKILGGKCLILHVYLLYSRSLPHMLGRGSRILSRHEREKGCGTHLRGSWDPRECWRWRGRHSDCRCRGGAGGGSDEIPATFRSPTTLTGDGGGVGRRRDAGGEQSHRWLRLTTRSARVWGVGGVYGTVNLVVSAAGPHLLLYGAGRRGPTSHLGWAPRSGRVCEGNARLGSVGVGVRVSRRSN
jgi:hypothetical protein